MARIPVPDQINPRAIAGDRLAMQAPDLSAPARALQGLGSALSGLAERYQADKNKMDAYNTNLQLERFTTDQTIGYQQDLDTSAPDGSDFLAKREKGLTEGYQKIRAGIKDPELGAKADLVFEQLRGNQLVKGTQDVKQKQTSYVLATTNESVSNIIQSGALDSKEQFDDYYENVIKPRIGSVITDPLQRQKMETTFGQQLREEYFRLHPEAVLPQPGADSLPIVTKKILGRVSAGSVEGVNPSLIKRFRLVQDAFGKSIPVVSGFRDSATNAKAGGAKKSQHMSGNAIDLDVSDLSIEERKRLIETASANGITGIGVYENSLHFDLGGRRAWGPSRRRESVPAWAAASIARHESGAARPQGQQPKDGNELWSRLIQTESGGDQSAVSPKGAIGAAQIMPGTGPEAAKLAGLPWDENRLKTDRAYNEALGKAYLGEQMKAFDGDAAKALAAYNAGPGRVKQAIAQYGDEWLKGVPAETQNYVAKILGGSPRGGARQQPRMPSGGIFEGMDGAEYDRYVTRARTQARTTIADIGKDELSSLEFNGEYTGRSLNADDFAIAYGEEGPDRFASYDAARETAAQKHAYKDMSSDQILADINKRSAETPDGEGAGEYISNLGELQAVAKKILDDRDVERKKYLTEVEGRIAAAGRRQIDIANTRNERFKSIQIEKAAQITAAAELLTLRKNDPAGYVFETNQGVRQAWREFDPRDPQSADAAIAATIAAQEAIGIGPGDIMPLPKEQAAAVAKIVLDDERPVDERMETMIGIVQQTRNPDHQRAIFKQLEKAGVPPAGEVVIDAYMRNDQGAARRLFTAATAKAENLPGKGQRETGFDDAVSDALFDEDSPGYAIYGLDYADPMSATIASRDLALVKTAATLSMAGGMAQDAAIAQAIKDVHGPMQMLDASFPNGGNVKGVIPEGTDPDMVAAGMDAVVPSIRTNLLGSKQLGLDKLPADVGPDAINVLTATQDNEVERIIEEGVFRNTGNGWGFFDVYSGTFIAYPNGTPMTWTTEELIGIGTRDLPPADRTAPMGDVPDVNPRLKQMMGIE